MACYHPAMSSAPILIEVRAAPGATTGTLRLGDQRYACALGWSGIRAKKREGDGGTPAGRLALREVLWRPDRGPSPATALPLSPIRVDDGWCDDPADARYNRRVRLPCAAGCEALWRDDPLYDVLAVIGWNDAPPRPGAGSAIFLHMARQGPHGLEPTEGCVAVAPSDLRALLAAAGPGSLIDIALA